VLLRLFATAAGVGLALAVASTTAAGKPPPPKAQWPPGAVDIATVSNGCGPGKASTDPHWGGQDSQTYVRDDGQKVTVDFREACDLHDAAYSGAFVWDAINGKFVDFSDPRWTRAAINEKFKHDLQRLCFRQVPQQAVWEKVTLECLTTDDLAGTWGALSYFRIVTSSFAKNPRERIKLTGQWKNQSPGFPPCDVGANRWTIKQVGRTVTAQWEHGTDGSQRGRFEGTFITGDELGDDRVEGTYTILAGERVVTKGTMTFLVLSGRRFDFKGSGPVGAGAMVEVERDTQGAATKCKAKPTAKPKPKPPVKKGTTLVLVPFTAKDCLAPKVIVGAACVDKSGMVVADKWTVADRHAEWAPQFWKTTYDWTIPQTIPAAGAPLTMRMTGTELTKNPNARICPAMGFSGGIEARSSGKSLPFPVSLGFCAESGQSASDSKTVTLVPPSSPPTAPLYLLMGAQDGPGYVYRYRAAT
jgi:hypothetical protein